LGKPLNLHSALELVESHDARLAELTSSESALVMSFDHLVVYSPTAEANGKVALGFRARASFLGVVDVDGRGTVDLSVTVSDAEFSL
jgi:bacillopeptidase F (M6 metalloprotease family)